MAIDPVCNMTVDEATAAATTELNGMKLYFCTGACKKAFDSHPERYLSRERR
ncbi:MAG: YHS domain-containing protein [Dehalococcoidia bacterium]|nr:YHS domain-containing protein [Dehalococcoidia bacterium]